MLLSSGVSYILYTTLTYYGLNKLNKTVHFTNKRCQDMLEHTGYMPHNVGGRMGEFCLLYLLCMLRFPVPLHSLHCAATASTGS
jgi:hypothetical protein